MSETTTSKLQELGYRPIYPGDGHPQDFVEQVENIIGSNLPEDFRQFLLSFPITGACSGFISVVGAQPSDFSEDGIYTWDRLYASSISDHTFDLLSFHQTESHR